MTTVSNTTSSAATTPSSSVPSTTAPQRTPSSSGQTSSSAAVTASAPAPRQAPLSYANVASVTSKKQPPLGPGAAVSSNSVTQPSGAGSGQHARSSSTTSIPVNGGGQRIQPAVPQIGNSGNVIPNGATSGPYSGGQHSRKSSLAGTMPNGQNRPVAPNIKFGAINEPGSSPQSSGPATAAGGSNLTAPVAPNPRSNSPLSSPSPAPQPVASGGAPPQAASARQIQFGDATQARPVSMPPVGPGGMIPSHNRRDSTHSAHGETGPALPHGRGMPPAGRGSRHQQYPNQYQNQSYGYGRGGYNPQGPNQQRAGPQNIGGPQAYPQQYPGSPHRVHRTPTMTHASPSMSNVVPTQQLYPPQQAPQFIPGSPQVAYQQMYQPDPNYYNPQYHMGYQQPQYPQTSPRPGYSHVAQPMPSGYAPYGVQGVTMSRSSSANVEMHRPASSMGQHPTPSMTPQPQNMVSPPAPGTPVQAPGTPYGASRPVVKRKAIEIKHPITGAAVKIEKPASTTPVVVSSSTHVVVSSPSPGPDRPASRELDEHSRSQSRSKTDAEKRAEMRQRVREKLEQDKQEEEKLKRQKEEEAKKAEEQKLKEEQQAAAEKKRQEEEEAAKKAAEEKARLEAEEKAKKEAEEKAKLEAEEKARAEADRLVKEKAEQEAKERAEREAAEKATAVESSENPTEEDTVDVKDDSEKTMPSTPLATGASSKASTPDSESMPPPLLRPGEKPRSKPSPLNLQIRTNEPAPPSAALTALRSARPIDNLKHLQYPEGIQSPNPALNPLATSKFKYDKEFLMQFQEVFKEKPSVDWDQRMRETVGDAESARPGTARTPSGTASRSTSQRGAPGVQPAMGGMGSFGGGMGAFKTSVSSMDRFARSQNTNPLANMGIVSNFSRTGGSGNLPRTNSSNSLSSSNQIPASPSSRNRSSRGGSKRGPGGVSMERQDSRQDKGGPTIPMSDVKPLEVSATRWKPISAGKKPTAAAVIEPTAAEEGNRMAPEMVQRKVKAALNKMTPEKFDKISDQILEITSQSRYESDGRTLRQVIQLTFEKATDEAAWSSMYAKFCKRMLDYMDPSIKDESIRDKHDQVVTGGNLFRKYLLNRCQEEFEQGWKVNLPPKPEGVSDEAVMLSDEYYIAAAAKRRGLGLVQFIGELFKLGMLTERIMNECVRKLLDFEGVPEDETVESLAKLLRTIGGQLDSSEKSKPRMDMYFARIDGMIQNKELNSRMRFMLMDIIDLRKKGWQTKEADKGPKTIQEIREEALKVQQEKDAASRANRGSRPQAGRGDARSFSHGGMPPGGYHDKGGGMIPADELRKLGNRQSRQVSSSSTFGPTSLLGNRSGSGSGSRRGLGPNLSRDSDNGPASRTATPPAPKSANSPNPFSLLGQSTHADDAAEGNDASTPPSNAGSPHVTNAELERVRSPPAEESK